jgi:Holliday junction resolvase RusA-like endonuclease
MTLGLFNETTGLTEAFVVDILVRGIPVSQGSMRAFVNPKTGHAQIVSKQRGGALGAWRDRIATEAQAAMQGRPPIRGPVKVQAVFTFPRPSTHLGKHGLLPSAPTHKITAPDIEKLARAWDSLTGIVWMDDAQVVEMHAAKRFGGEPGVHLRVQALG